MKHLAFPILLVSLASAFAVSAQLPGDVCETALPIVIPGAIDGNTCGFTNNYDIMCPYDDMLSPDMVYTHVPAEDQVLDFNLCTGITDYDTKIYIYAEACTGWDQLVACNDDACTAPNYTVGPYVSHMAHVMLIGGTTYFIIVDGYGHECGNFTLSVSLTPPNPPQHLTIRRDLDPAPHIVLRWNPSFAANTYFVYRDSVPSPTTLLATTSDTVFVDSNAVDNSRTQFFYAVTAGIE